jgi:COMPASS component BRE2
MAPAKKRKLSPSASSRSSATPAPPGVSDALLAPGINGIPSSIPRPASPPAHAFSTHREDGDGESGPSRSSVSVAREALATPAGHVERTVAKHGVVQPGSGDGAGCGDECFLWSDLPMNKHGECRERGV